MSAAVSARIRVLVVEVVAVLLTAGALDPLLDGTGWAWTVALSTATAVLVAELLRRAGLPRPLVPVGTLAALLVELVVTRVHDVAPYGMVPSLPALRALGHLTSTGFSDSSAYTAPVTPTPGLMLLVAGGTGFVAVAVDTLAVTYRRPAVAGLPLLALYAVPAAIAPHGVPWYWFALGATGYLALLYTESRDRVTRWGRVLGLRGGGPRTSALGALGRRVGGTALAAAVVVPAVAPGVGDDPLHLGDATAGDGLSSGQIGSTDPLVNLSRDLGQRTPVPVLSFSVPTAGGQAAPYLRTAVFDRFNGNRWVHDTPTASTTAVGGTLTTGFPATTGEARTVTVATQDGLTTHYLPLPYGSTKVTGLKGGWSADSSSEEVFSTGKKVSGLHYSVRQADPAPVPSALLKQTTPAKLGARYLDTGGLDTSSVFLTAREQAVGEESRPYAQALLLQSWFRDRGGFAYDESAPVPVSGTRTLIDTFLTERRGFCVHYASAMVLMARSLGIPARLAIGYLPGAQQSTRDGQSRYVVTSVESHAWPELYFKDYGWLRFEPTPRSDGLTQSPAYATAGTEDQIAALTATASASASSAPSSSSSSSASASRGSRPDDTISATSGGGSGGSGGSRTPLLVLAGALAVVLLALLPALARRRLRGRRQRAAGVPALWDELSDTAADLGLPGFSRSHTPRQYAALLGRYIGMRPGTGSPLEALAAAYERSRYAPDAPASLLPGARAQLAEVRTALGEAVGRRDRWRAALLPRSTWGGLLARTARASEWRPWSGRGTGRSQRGVAAARR
ncbi:transglutaminase superfamily protein [Motilibacter rhizosphaerae]|uniref:Transglutaminase superfamily protein n=1 Tax=Motilibacter rhizosphaerae TaxID=598652 RepID=A0A4Q7NG90_9ACTN|nr:DUF3488 and transglutaminase-like domain-containing protein [Motilibacter rhizosphaerae]RZS82930.1 transglutaminase superfamily protein [Motilibacter rhizosphaerae]